MADARRWREIQAADTSRSAYGLYPVDSSANPWPRVGNFVSDSGVSVGRALAELAYAVGEPYSKTTGTDTRRVIATHGMPRLLNDYYRQYHGAPTEALRFTPAFVEAYRTLFAAILAFGEAAVADGKNTGENLLVQLAEGSIAFERFNALSTKGKS